MSIGLLTSEMSGPMDVLFGVLLEEPEGRRRMKMFVCDLDGTLLNARHETDEKILQCLDRVHRKGCYFAVATGRNINGIRRNKGLWEAPVYLIAMNGALILDIRRNVIFQQSISPCFVKELLLKFPTCHFEFITKDRTYIRISREEYVEEFQHRSIWRNVWSQKDPEEFETYLSQYVFHADAQMICDREILKINCLELDPGRYQKLEDHIRKNADMVVNAPFEPNVFEITDKVVDKGKVVEQLVQILGIGREAVVVFGDGENDIPMLERFPHSCAMENAGPKVKAAASEVIGHYRDYAVLDKIDRLLNQKGICEDGENS